MTKKQNVTDPNAKMADVNCQAMAYTLDIDADKTYITACNTLQTQSSFRSLTISMITKNKKDSLITIAR